MISYLEGLLLEANKESIVLLVGGVGYKMFVSEKMLSALPPKGQTTRAYTYLRLKKDETIELYGVPTREALGLFEVLLGVQGVGPKGALILSSLGSIQDVRKAITEGDQQFFAGVKGIGAKKIQKIILELTGKLDIARKGSAGPEEESMDALLGLGFSRTEIKAALDRLPQDKKISPPERVREALKILRRQSS